LTRDLGNRLLNLLALELAGQCVPADAFELTDESNGYGPTGDVSSERTFRHPEFDHIDQMPFPEGIEISYGSLDDGVPQGPKGNLSMDEK
jgi:hypothetical protein